jgi:hypothetical protein
MPTSILWVIVSSVSQKLKALLIVLIVATCLGNALPPAPHHGTASAQPYPGTENPIQLWNTTWGGAVHDSGYGVAVNSDIYLAGRTYFGAHRGDAFLVKYDVDGNQLWNTTWGGAGYDFGRRLAIGNDIYLTGNTYSFGAGYSDAFLVKYDVDGNQLWNTTWGGVDNEYGHGVAVGSDIYLAGYIDSRFGAGGADAFLVKYGSPPSVGGEVVPLNNPALAVTLIKSNIAYITIIGAIVLAILVNRRR